MFQTLQYIWSHSYKVSVLFLTFEG